MSNHNHSCCHDHCNGELDLKTHDHKENKLVWKNYLPAIISFILLVIGFAISKMGFEFFNSHFKLLWYIIAYLFVGASVNIEAFKQIKQGNVFSEFFLMSIATIGAFIIGEYAEGVAVMLFYSIGELIQESSVNKAKNNIKALLDVRPDTATVIRNTKEIICNPREIKIGETIRVKSGEKVALDGILVSKSSSFNTAALTGESKPDTKINQDLVLAGMINLNTICEIQVISKFEDSKLSRILEMVQEATARKSKTQKFISKFAKIYTPIVVVAAVIIAISPILWVSPYVFSDWLYRALVFLVVSCPCALVISVPLGYFGGIGLASKNGILFKGGNFLDVMTKIDTVVVDKTGTLTKGVFEVQEVHSAKLTEDKFIQYATSLERYSTHPIAMSIVSYASEQELLEAEDVEEIMGYGIKGIINGQTVLAGNTKLLKKYGISYPKEIDSIIESVVVIAIDNEYAGYITVADQIKADAPTAIQKLQKMGIKIVMLSGDKTSITKQVADKLNIDTAFGNLLPEDKVIQVEKLKNEGKHIAFVGDGINDAPVLASADVGIAMGGLGSDVAIETADVVIQNDQPSKIADAIKIGKETRKIIYQNIIMAFAVKLIVLSLGATGDASLWLAIFADVGVALIAILNAVRVQNLKIT